MQKTSSKQSVFTQEVFNLVLYKFVESPQHRNWGDQAKDPSQESNLVNMGVFDGQRLSKRQALRLKLAVKINSAQWGFDKFVSYL